MASESSPQILVLTSSDDTTADGVERILAERRVPYLRVDTADFPMKSRLTAAYGPGGPVTMLALDGMAPVDLGAVRTVWYRMPQPFMPALHLETHERNFVINESTFGFGGMLRTLQASWMNHPSATVEARYKILQLNYAEQCGLTIPPTLVTNDARAAVDFVRNSYGAVIKALSNPVVSVSAGSRDTGIIMTTDVTVDQLSDTAAIRQVPCFLQKKIPKQVDIRVVIVDEVMFSVAIDSQEYAETQTDFRRRIPWLKHSVTSVPDDVAAALRRLMVRFGLRFGVVDMALTPDGEYVFFEVNPSGQWGWLERLTSLPMSSAVADALVRDLATDGGTPGDSSLRAVGTRS